jgi:hypothetical protein
MEVQLHAFLSTHSTGGCTANDVSQRALPFFSFFLREKERHWSSDFTLQVGNRFEFSDRELKDSQCNENLHRIYTNYELTANISSIIPYLFLMFCVL